MTSQLNSICRTCLNDSKTYHHLCDYVEESYRILEMLDGIVPQIDIKGSSQFSSLMCQSCVDKLLIGYKFQQLCIESNNRLQDLSSAPLYHEPEEIKIKQEWTDTAVINVKQEIKEEALSECETQPNESGIEPDNDNSWAPDDGDSRLSDSSNEQISALKERLTKETSAKEQKFKKPKLETPVQSAQSTWCHICDKDFRFNSKYTEHMRTHSGECPYPCTQCDKKFRRLSNYRQHMQRHLGLKRYKCPHCPKKFYRKSDLMRHGPVHLHKTPVQRPSRVNNFCMPNFKRKEEELKDANSFKCTECGVSFEKKDLLAAHVTTHKKNDSLNTTPTKEDINLADSVQENTAAIEVIPKASIRSNSEFMPQMFKKSVNDLDDEEVRPKNKDSEDATQVRPFHKFDLKESVNTENSNQKDARFPCSMCEKVFDKPSRLKRHSLVHSMERKHICGICKYRFQNATILKGHLSKHQNGTVRVKQYRKTKQQKDKGKPVCSLCEKEFANSYNLKEHMRVHSGECPFLCTQCGKKFRYSSALKDHMRTHSGESPYQCLICGKKFRHSCSLKRHTERHNDLKEYQCPDCPSRFNCKADLVKHRKIKKLHAKIPEDGENDNEEEHMELTNSSSWFENRDASDGEQVDPLDEINETEAAEELNTIVVKEEIDIYEESMNEFDDNKKYCCNELN